MNFFEELKRRNVFRVGIAYVLMSWVLLQGADFVLDVAGAPDWVIRTLIIVVGVGLPIALFFAWAFEVTPEGIKREADVDRSASVAPHTGRKLDRAIIVFLVLVVVGMGVERFYSGPEPAPGGIAEIRTDVPVEAETEAEAEATTAKSIAVLPFANMSSDPEQEFFSDGITEEILNALAQVPDLKVAGRTSSFAFKDRNEDLRAIGEALGVNHILEGSVRKAGNQVRITAQLIKADDGFHLWSETFDRELTDVFAIQDEIAAAILAQLETQLAVGSSIDVAEVDLAVYDQYLKARQLMRGRAERELQQASGLLDQVIAQDPGYAPALAQRAIVELMLSDRFGHYGSIPFVEALDNAEDYAQRALTVDPDDPDALAVQGYILGQRGQPDRGIAMMERALVLSPNHTNAMNWLAGAYGNSGELQKEFELRERLFRIDPLYPPGIGNLMNQYDLRGEPEKMQPLIDSVTPYLSGPSLNYVKAAAAWGSILQGREAEAIQRIDALPPGERGWGDIAGAIGHTRLLEYERALPYVEGQPAMVFILGRLGRTEEALQLGKRLLAGGQGLGAYVGVLQQMGRHEEIVALVESRFETPGDMVRQNSGGGRGAALVGDIIYAYRMTGRESQADRTLALYRDALEHQQDEGADNDALSSSLAQLAMLEGDPELALEHLERAVDQGAIDDFARHSPIFQPLLGEPRYQALMIRVNQHRNEQRALLDLPPIEFET